MAALLMRDTRPEQMVDRVAPLLDRTREKVEARQARQAAREYVFTSDPVDLPEDAWRRAMRAIA